MIKITQKGRRGVTVDEQDLVSTLKEKFEIYMDDAAVSSVLSQISTYGNYTILGAKEKEPVLLKKV